MKEMRAAKRESNFELLRIIAMLLIVAYHVVCGMHAHPFFEETGYPKSIEFTSIMMGSWGILGVDIFLVISAYFLQNKKFDTKKIFTIIFQVFCFEVMFSLVQFIYIYHTQGVSMAVKEAVLLLVDRILQPFWATDYWYITTYVFLYTLSPLLNKIIGCSRKDQLEKILIMFAFIPVYSNFWVGTPPVANIANFVYFYLIVGYLKMWRRENVFEKYSLLGIVLVTGVIIGSQWLYMSLPSKGLQGMIRNFLPYTTGNINRHSIVLWIDALFIFGFFKNLTVKPSRVINFIASCTLGVYLFHENPIFFPMKDLSNQFLICLFDPDSIREAFLFYLFGDIVLLFSAGVVIEFFRKQTMDRYLLTYIEKKLVKYFKKVDNWFENI